MFGNMTAREGSHVTGKYRDENHAARMLQACSLDSSQVLLGERCGSRTTSKRVWLYDCVLPPRSLPLKRKVAWESMGG